MQTTLLALTCLVHSATGATLADFGYNHMQIDGQEARGHRPLLVILVSFASGPALSHPNSYYDDLVFNLFSTNSVNSYFVENSNSRFFWERAGAGVIGPLSRPATERSTNWVAIAKAAGLEAVNVHWADYLWFSNVVAQAMMSGLFNFADYDTDGSGIVTGDELALLIISNDVSPDSDGEGATRWTTRVKPPGSTVAVEEGATAIQHNASFNVLAHECCHLLGTWDLYGAANLSADLSLMCGTTSRTRIYHLDPWHKCSLSWSEPRIRSLRAGGVAVLPATQLTQADAPVILYDPLGDPNEFFMVEYRTPSSPVGNGYDRNVAGSGLVIWHVKQDGGKNPVYLADLSLGPLPGQPKWRWCSKCQGLAYAGNPSAGPCPEGGLHVTTNGSPYQLVTLASAPGQHDWRWCHKCQSLFFGGGESTSVCPAGGGHERTVSSDYSLVADSPGAAGQHGWRWCRKCQGLFYGPSQAQSDCPADGLRHDGSASGDYAVVMTSEARGVFAEGAPDLRHGGNVVWGSGETTPNLRWLDGSEMPVRIYVHPFSLGDGSITIEWLRDESYWVDFAYTGIFEFGTFELPFNTLAEGVTAVPHGGTIHLKAGSGNETASVTKRVRLQAYGGPVTIGR